MLLYDGVPALGLFRYLQSIAKVSNSPMHHVTGEPNITAHQYNVMQRIKRHRNSSRQE